MKTEIINLYQDTNLHSGYLQLMQGADSVEELVEAENKYFSSVLSKVYDSVKEVYKRNTQQKVFPELKIYPPDHPENSQALYVDQNGLHAGLDLLKGMDAAFLAYTDFLLDNYLFQISPIMGDTPKLSQVISPEMFPLEALTLNAASLFPDAVANDGYTKKTFQELMEFVQEFRHSQVPADELSATLSKMVVKPAKIDFQTYLEGLEFEQVMDLYLDKELGPYCLSLHCQLLFDAIYFMLSHEVAHFLLGHHLVEPETSSQSRFDESQADILALETLREVSGFEIRALLTLFSFWHLSEEEIKHHLLDHPFSRDRMLILAETILNEPEGISLRADVNAGMMLMTEPLESLIMEYKWDELEEEDLISIFHYSDMDYNAHLFFYIERPANEAGMEDVKVENVFLLSHITFEIKIVLRDRIHPEIIYYHGRALFRPGFVAEDLLFKYNEDTVMTRLHLRIPAPPEWWLDHLDAEVVVESVNFANEPLPEIEDKTRHSLYIYLDETEIDYSRHLQLLPSPVTDLSTRNSILLAARRFRELGMQKLAIQFDDWLYQFDDQILPYNELIQLSLDLIREREFSKAAKIARHALSSELVMRPGFHLIIATDYAEKNQFSDAFEHAFIEMYGFGEFGEYFDAASGFLAEVASQHTDPMMQYIQEFRSHYDAGLEMASKESRKADSLKRMYLAKEALVKAAQEAQTDYVFLREINAELFLNICELEKKGYTSAIQAFEDVLELMPQFVPAYIQLARIMLLQGEQSQSHTLWKKAYSIMPFNHFVFEFREYVEKTNPDNILTSLPVSKMFTKPDPEEE